MVTISQKKDNCKILVYVHEKNVDIQTEDSDMINLHSSYFVNGILSWTQDLKTGIGQNWR